MEHLWPVIAAALATLVLGLGYLAWNFHAAYTSAAAYARTRSDEVTDVGQAYEDMVMVLTLAQNRWGRLMVADRQTHEQMVMRSRRKRDELHEALRYVQTLLERDSATEPPGGRYGAQG